MRRIIMDDHFVAFAVGQLEHAEKLRSLPPVHDHGGAVVEFRHGWLARLAVRLGHALTAAGQRLSARQAVNPLPTFTTARSFKSRA
jgi:hypothetical protein